MGKSAAALPSFAVLSQAPLLPPQEEAEELAAQACYVVRDAACGIWDCMEGRCKDYVASPKSNGYQSLHSTMRCVGRMGGRVGLAGAQDLHCGCSCHPVEVLLCFQLPAASCQCLRDCLPWTCSHGAAVLQGAI